MLSECGDNLCLACAMELLIDNTIICPICNKPTERISNINELPKNLALLQITRNPKTCLDHGKNLEAYCESDKKLLCIDCILLDGHKKHEIGTLIKSAEKERNFLRESIESSKKSSEALKLALQSIDCQKEKLNDNAQQYHTKVTDTFSELIQYIQRYEVELKQKMDIHLEEEVAKLNQVKMQLERQLESIEDFLRDSSSFLRENKCELLSKSKDRKQKLINTKKPTIANLNIEFPVFNPKEELVNLWKLIVNKMSIQDVVEKQKIKKSPVKQEKLLVQSKPLQYSRQLLRRNESSDTLNSKKYSFTIMIEEEIKAK